MDFLFPPEIFLLLSAVVIGMAVSVGKGQAGKLTAHEYRGPVDPSLGRFYLLYLPRNYGEFDGLYPFIYFLHGAGERGNDPERVRRQGLPNIVERFEDFPFIVLAPQCPTAIGWSQAFLEALLDDILGWYPVDGGRLYLTGMSMGGYAAWNLATMHPSRFAAIAPICGGGNPQLASRLTHLPIWAFHGAKDEIVPLSESQMMVDAVRKAGNREVRFTVYPEAGHDSWTETYNNPELYAWFLEHPGKI